MKRKILGDNITPKCCYCKNGCLSADGKHVLCEKAGVLELDYSCKKYVYDPLKRVPQHPTDAMEFTAEDFRL